MEPCHRIGWLPSMLSTTLRFISRIISASQVSQTSWIFPFQALVASCVKHLELRPSDPIPSLIVSYIAFIFSISVSSPCVYLASSLLVDSMLSSLILFATQRQHILTITMVGTRKTPVGRTTVTLDGSPIVGPVGAEEDTIDIIPHLSVGLPPLRFLSYVDFLGTTNLYATLLGQNLHQPLRLWLYGSTYASDGPYSLFICVSE
jgi:hypothetical protein